jgi:hypothetical protein
MPIDASVYSGIKPIDAINPLQTMGQIMALKQSAQQQQLQGVQLEGEKFKLKKLQDDEAEDDAIRMEMAKAENLDPETKMPKLSSVQRALLAQGRIPAAMKVGDQITKNATAHSQQAKAELDYQIGQLKEANGVLRGVLDGARETDPETGEITYNQEKGADLYAKAMPALGKVLQPEMIKALPQTFDGPALEAHARVGMTLEDSAKWGLQGVTLAEQALKLKNDQRAATAARMGAYASALASTHDQASWDQVRKDAANPDLYGYDTAIINSYSPTFSDTERKRAEAAAMTVRERLSAAAEAERATAQKEREKRLGTAGAGTGAETPAQAATRKRAADTYFANEMSKLRVAFRGKTDPDTGETLPGMSQPDYDAEKASILQIYQGMLSGPGKLASDTPKDPTQIEAAAKAAAAAADKAKADTANLMGAGRSGGPGPAGGPGAASPGPGGPGAAPPGPPGTVMRPTPRGPMPQTMGGVMGAPPPPQGPPPPPGAGAPGAGAPPPPPQGPPPGAMPAPAPGTMGATMAPPPGRPVPLPPRPVAPPPVAAAPVAPPPLPGTPGAPPQPVPEHVLEAMKEVKPGYHVVMDDGIPWENKNGTIRPAVTAYMPPDIAELMRNVPAPPVGKIAPTEMKNGEIWIKYPNGVVLYGGKKGDEKKKGK